MVEEDKSILSKEEKERIEKDLYTDPNKKSDDKENYNDMYDIVDAVMSVKSKHDVLNQDFIVADLQSNLFENTAILYVKEHLNIIVAMNNYLSIEGDKENKELINKLLLDEVYSLVNLSRASMGKVLLAILEYIKGQGQVGQLPNQEEQQKGIIGRTIDKVTGANKVEQ